MDKIAKDGDGGPRVSALGIWVEGLGFGVFRLKRFLVSGFRVFI